MKLALLLIATMGIATACSRVEPQESSRVGNAAVSWDGPWTVAQGTYEGSLLFARIHRGITPLIGDPRYSQRVGIAVPLRNPDSRGLPTSEELAQLAAIEDAISAALEPDHASVQVLTITTKGMREFVLYTTNARAVRAALDTLQSSILSHELQLMIQPDPEWSVYRQFAR